MQYGFKKTNFNDLYGKKRANTFILFVARNPRTSYNPKKKPF